MELLSAEIPMPPGVVAFFTTRSGGVSDPPFHSLNLSLNVGDECEAVYENRMRLADNLPSEPMWLRQAHSSRVLRADAIKRDMDVGDAATTASAGVVCAVQTADCLPVLFYHEDGGGVGAAHAGWRGLAAGVLENTVAAMQAQNASPLTACLGPAIGAANYVVGNDVYQALASGAASDSAFSPCADEAGKWHADLSAIAARRLLAAGVAEVHAVEFCTHDRRELLFSARRDGGRTGRQAAVIYFTS